MPVQKQVLLLFPLILLFFCFPVVSLASTTTSQAGIVFTESDESAKKKELDEKKIPSTGSEEVKKDSYLPQTGEKHQTSILIVGSLLLVGSVVKINRVKRR